MAFKKILFLVTLLPVVCNAEDSSVAERGGGGHQAERSRPQGNYKSMNQQELHHYNQYHNPNEYHYPNQYQYRQPVNVNTYPTYEGDYGYENQPPQQSIQENIYPTQQQYIPQPYQASYPTQYQNYPQQPSQYQNYPQQQQYPTSQAQQYQYIPPQGTTGSGLPQYQTPMGQQGY